MVLMKAADFAASNDKKETFNLSDIAAEARAMISQAQKKRDKMIADAQADIEQARIDGHAEGKEAGHAEGFIEGKKTGHEEALAEARENYKKLTDETHKMLGEILNNFEQIKNQLLWQAEQGTIALALAIAEKVVKQKGHDSREVVSENLKAALELISGTTDVVVKVNPKDFDHLHDMTDKSEQSFGGYHHIKFDSDESIRPGGCIVVTENGQIDTTLETQISRIADELLMTDRSQQTTGE